MTFRFSGFGKSLGFGGHGSAAGCAPTSAFGGGSFSGGHGGGHGGAHGGGLFGGFKGGFDKMHGFGRNKHDHDDDHDDDASGSGNGSSGGTSGGSTGGSTGGATVGTGYPEIPANTAGITFHVDLEGDGVEDDYIPIGRDNDTKTFEDYLAKARDQVAAEHPDADPKEVIVKATITARGGEETYYHFTGLEEGSAASDDQSDDDQDCDDQESDDDNGDDDDCWGGGRHGHGGEGRSCGTGHADFFTSLTGGGKSFDHGHDRDDEDEDDGDRDHADFEFC